MGQDGNDSLYGQAGADSLYGNDGADCVQGGDGNDYIWGGSGNDTLDGGSGVDSLASGSDKVYGEDGDDLLYGRDGNDTLYGADGMDTLYGGSGADMLLGGIGNDRLYGEGENDSLDGGSADDTINTGDDMLDGGAGDDCLMGQDGNDSLYGQAGADSLYGNDGADCVQGGDGNDYIWGGSGNDTLDGGSGVDSLASGSDKVYGEDGDDLLYGRDGNDTLYGADGMDTLYGGSGADMLLGGIGNDRLYGEGESDSLDGGSADDTINTGDDMLDGGAGDDCLMGQDGNDSLYGQAGADSLYGNDGADCVQGGDGNDYIWGGSGNDTLDGGSGVDSLASGSDKVYGEDGDDLLYGRDGNDTLYGGWSVDIVNTGNDVLDGGAGDDCLMGQDGNDSLYGQAGADSVYGGDGADWAQGGSGNDCIFGGAGDDWVSYEYVSGQGVRVNLITGSGSTWNSSETDTLVDIENVRGTDYADSLTGNGVANSLVGLGNNDTLCGMDGDDTLQGGAGNDSLDGGAGVDRLDYSYRNAPSFTSGITVHLDTGTATASDETDTIVLGTAENVTGSDFDDSLFGDAKANVLNGGSGNDLMNGGAGNDTLAGGAGTDTLSGDADMDVADFGDRSGVTIHIGAYVSGDEDNVQETVERLVGSPGNDTVSGDLHNNYIDGGAGNDSLLGGEGDDTLVGGEGTDTLDGGDDVDTADYSQHAPHQGIVLHLGSYQAGDEDSIGATGSIETIVGSAYADTIVGSPQNDYVDGRGGDDSLDGGAGNDTLVGGGGGDQLRGGDGDDSLVGDGGDMVWIDAFYGGLGTNWLVYGSGDRFYSTGVDVFMPDGAGGPPIDNFEGTAVEAFETVYNTIEYQPYRYLVKGAQATKDTRAGNAWDQANLLVSMLDELYIPAQLVHGTLKAPKTQVADWLSVKDASAAEAVLRSAGLYKSSDTGTFTFEHVWVQADVDGTGIYRDMDPSWKFKAFRPGIDISDVSFDHSAYGSYIQRQTPYEYYEQQIADHLATAHPGNSLADVPYDGPIIARSFNAIPESVTETRNADGTTYSADSQSIFSRVCNISLCDADGNALPLVDADGMPLADPETGKPSLSLDVSEVGTSPITVRYVPAGTGLMPQIAVDGVVWASGTTARAEGSAIRLRVDAGTPCEFQRRVGQPLAIAIGAQQTSEALLTKHQAKANALAIQAYEGQASVQECQEALLGLTAMTYLHETAEQRAGLAALSHIVLVPSVEVGLITGDADLEVPSPGDCHWQLPNPIFSGDLATDMPGMRFLAACPISGIADYDTSEMQEFLELIGENGSVLENAVLEELVNSESISTMKGIAWARAQANQVPVYIVSKPPLATGRATGSSPSQEGHDYTRATDGLGTLDHSNSWKASSTDVAWILVDLGAGKPITGAKLWWAPGNHAKEYCIEVSDDANHWTSVYTQENGDGGIDVVSDLTATAR